MRPPPAPPRTAPTANPPPRPRRASAPGELDLRPESQARLMRDNALRLFSRIPGKRPRAGDSRRRGR